jgi:hypothetical protein
VRRLGASDLLAIGCALALLLASPSTRADIDPPEKRLETGYAQYGAALSGEFLASPGAICPAGVAFPCVIGSGGGLVVRAGYRFHAPFYLGAAYESSKQDAHKSIYLAILQQLRVEARYFVPVPGGYRPFVTGGAGVVGYGSQWALDTVGSMAFLGFGLEVEFSRSTLMSIMLSYRPMLLANWRDSATFEHPTGVISLIGLEIGFEQLVPIYEPADP